MATQVVSFMPKPEKIETVCNIIPTELYRLGPHLYTFIAISVISENFYLEFDYFGFSVSESQTPIDSLT